MTRRRRSYLGSATVLWLVILLFAGSVRRWVDSVLSAAPAAPVALKAPLAALPTKLGSWTGVDVAVDARVIKVAGTDDHLHRRYVDDRTGATVNLYLGYTSRPVNMLGHRPDICYPANGWMHQSTREEQLLLSDGRQVPCLIHHFDGDGAEAHGLVVLNYYILQGRHTTQWRDFWGPKWRRPNLSRDPTYYVAQVQVAGAALLPAMADRAEAAVRRFAAVAAPSVEAVLSQPAAGQE